MKSNNFNNLVIAIYSHPDYYPPTLNAIEYLAEIYDNIYIVHRNIYGFDWKYPNNVKLIGPKKLVNVRDAEKANLFSKIRWFITFTILLYKQLRKYNPKNFLIYDTMPILSFRILYHFIKKPKIIWYHNHDIVEGYTRKWSLIWFAWKSEAWLFDKLNIFSLPSLERKQYFPINLFKGKFYFLPNYPSQKVIKRFCLNAEKKIEGTVKLLYQGSIGPLHGLEEIIPLLNHKINGQVLQLVLKGFISDEYYSSLKKIAIENNVSDKLIYIGPTGYQEVIQNASICHIGIGIHKKKDLMNSTLGTASNKIYEYIAVGMPVLLYNNEHFKSILNEKSWAVFTDTSTESIFNCLKYIIDNYLDISNNAKNDFILNLSFEKYFNILVKENL